MATLIIGLVHGAIRIAMLRGPDRPRWTGLDLLDGRLRSMAVGGEDVKQPGERGGGSRFGVGDRPRRSSRLRSWSHAGGDRMIGQVSKDFSLTGTVVRD
jgi:hypothetical protein